MPMNSSPQRAERWPRLSARRLGLWCGLIAFAIGGSCVFGASLSWVLPELENGSRRGLARAVGGLAWMLFIPALALIARRPIAVCFEASLITMAAGEVMLLGGALANSVCAGWPDCARGRDQLRHRGPLEYRHGRSACGTAATSRCPVVRTLLAWMVVLNVAGAVLFALFYAAPSRHEHPQKSARHGRSPAQCWLFSFRTTRGARKIAASPTRTRDLWGSAFWNIVVCEVTDLRPALLPGRRGLAIGMWLTGCMCGLELQTVVCWKDCTFSAATATAG